MNHHASKDYPYVCSIVETLKSVTVPGSCFASGGPLPACVNEIGNLLKPTNNTVESIDLISQLDNGSKYSMLYDINSPLLSYLILS